jgi:hypothetical protein
MSALRNRVAVVVAAISIGALGVSGAGCSSKAEGVRQERARELAASLSRPAVTSKPAITTVAAGSVAQGPERVAKPGRDLAFGKFADAGAGVSFRYPRSFALLESAVGDDDENSDRVISWQQAREAGAGVRTQEELAKDDPGADLLATVVVPDDAYPNTSFAGGSVQVAINRYQTAGTCRASLLARMGDAKGASGTVMAQGVAFAWIDRDEGDGSTEFYERDYAGFANGVCYEFFVRVGVGSGGGVGTVASAVGDVSPTVAGSRDAALGAGERNGEESSGARAPDEKKIFAHLERIVASLQVEEQRVVSVLDRPKYKQTPQ